MKKVISIAIYIVCLAVIIFTYGDYQKKFIVLGFNNEKIYGEIKI